jgi:type I restriction enzyme M protein
MMFAEIEKRLWDAADELRANSHLRSSEYSTPVLGLIFLRYADHKFSISEKQLASKATGRRTIGKADYQAQGVMYLPEIARFSYLLKLPEKSDIGKEINAAMKAIEEENPSLKDVLPKNYNQLDKKVLIELLKLMASISMEHDGDTLGRIYEYFLGEFAMAEGQHGGEFYTPTSIVKLIVEIIEPFHGLILDPACGSGGMFVQSARFVAEHKKKPSAEISIYGQEKTKETVRLCKMNLAVHGIEGDIREANTYKEDVHKSVGKFDFVMANPPFNVNRVDMESLKEDPRFPFGLPTTDNANYLWIQIFYSALNSRGRAGFVMANSAADARSSELEIRKRIIKSGNVDVIVSIGPNFFYTVTLPVTLWFFDKEKAKDLKDKVLFIDARNIYNQINRALRDFKPEQIEFLANIAKLYRGEEISTKNGSEAMMKESFPKGKYRDVPGLCKIATLKEIEEQGWSLNPGRYVGVAERPAEEYDFKEKLIELNAELEKLNAESKALEKQISQNVNQLLKKI